MDEGVLTLLGEVWKRYPALRFFQLMAFIESEMPGDDQFYPPDVDTAKRLRDILAEEAN